MLATRLAAVLALPLLLLMPPTPSRIWQAWFALDRSGAFSGAPTWIVPIYECPLDHVLEPNILKPLQTVREHSFLSNQRVAAAVLASQASTSLERSNAAGELARIAKEYSDVKVLTVSNLAAIALESRSSQSSMYRLGFLHDQHRKRLEHAGFHTLTGSWCCAPLNDPGPQHHTFRLRIT